ncbi:GyrI-like domain-containing protein [Paenibacillus daejeonensis]|uniref:GyrI-like domain-containing protein n=1 Tax=Paenibacillus daejeonensis TaxID=135193 RepID=UPI0003789EA6|nr:GyrI-like domain-containing protein [Paenibacillus daejeonensis]
MSVQIVDKISFTVIGKLGQGLAAEGPKWIPTLWQEAEHKFEEIQNLVKLDEEGNPVGLWGAMSDIAERFDRWTNQGKYLAGCEALDHCVAPPGWARWIIPSYKYAVIPCNQDTYQRQFNYMINEYLPSNGYSIVGAVHEHYKSNETNGNLYLYFPIHKL